MAVLDTNGIICAVRSHGEHGAIVRVLTACDGLVAGYVRGGRSRVQRPVLVPGNRVQAHFRARTAEQLASLTVELSHSIAPLLGEPLPAAAIDWLAALTAASLPEQAPCPALFDALTALLDAVEAAAAARQWAPALARYEWLLLAELGFGLDLARCAVTGEVAEITHVSPRTGAGVGARAAAGHEARLLPVPAFLAGGGAPSWDDAFAGLRLTGFLLEHSVLTDRRVEILAARERLVTRLKRAVA